MAFQPGPFTQWPWHRLGNLKYALLAPFLAHSIHKYVVKETDMFNLTIFPALLLRLLHTQLWITLSRFRTTKGKHRIVDKSLNFDQVDREKNWDDQILLTALSSYALSVVVPWLVQMPLWDAKGAFITIFLHMGPVEFIYYWLHRALHHNFLYSRYHSHHHASIVTEPITSVIHPFAEVSIYFMLFAFPLLTVSFAKTASIVTYVAYMIYVDFMNYMGHCNFELVPQWLFDAFPPLKYLMYTPSFHSIHHTKFRTNYSLFMPFYDYIYGTLDESKDELQKRSLKGKEEVPHVIHLTHLTTLQSIYHLRLGFSSLASNPYPRKLHMWLMWPLICLSMLLTRICGTAFTVESNRLRELSIETWAIPRYRYQYMSRKQREKINALIEKAILEAENMGVKVMSLGLLNQGDELNRYGALYLRKNPELKMRIIDGTSLAVATVINSLPRGTEEVLLIGKFSKMAYVLASVLCQKGVQVLTIQRDQYELLEQNLPSEFCSKLVYTSAYSTGVWLVGDRLKDQEQKKAAKCTKFIPFSQFPLNIIRNDCIYYSTPAMMVPMAYENLHSCENWLPRRMMSAWRVAGIVNALEDWDEHECGDMVTNIDKVWHAALCHGFCPIIDN